MTPMKPNDVTIVAATRDERLLLYFDLLGFREMVKTGQADLIHRVLALAMQKATYEADKRSDKLKTVIDTIYFSDTILLYPKTAGFHSETFKQLRFAANAICRALLSESIPVSGAMTFGSFVVGKVDGHREPVYFGQALIDAYDFEKQEKWLGILVCPSVASRLDPAEIEAGAARGTWRVRGKAKGDTCLLLNPFQPILALAEQKKRPAAISALKSHDQRVFLALQFIHQTSQDHAQNGNFSSSAAVRYHAVAAFAKSVLGDERYNWAVSLPKFKTKGTTSSK